MAGPKTTGHFMFSRPQNALKIKWGNTKAILPIKGKKNTISLALQVNKGYQGEFETFKLVVSLWLKSLGPSTCLPKTMPLCIV